jgi:hypothetical protein
MLPNTVGASEYVRRLPNTVAASELVPAKVQIKNFIEMHPPAQRTTEDPERENDLQG